jgi:ABC-type oligopeptide transport system substrate-binding subunit
MGTMGRLEPALAMEGTAASAIELTHEYVLDHAAVVDRSELELTLAPRPESALSAQSIATTVEFLGITAVRLEGRDRVRIRFIDAIHRAEFERWGMLYTGPYRIEARDTNPVRLLRRTPGAIDVIELHALPTEEVWRRLHGRKLDVIPTATASSRPRFEQLSSVRTTGLETTTVFAAYFNLDNPTVADVAVRRAIVRALDRRAIARAICGSDRCALAEPEPTGASDAAQPERLRITALRVSDDLQHTAEVVRHQLRGAGVEVELVTIDSTDEAGLFDGPDIALAVAPWSRTQQSYSWFSSPSTGGPALTGYANPEYDRAVARSDLETARRLLERDVPVVPLVRVHAFAIIDNRFCGDVVPSATTWRWLDDLHPCAPGETP